VQFKMSTGITNLKLTEYEKANLNKIKKKKILNQKI
jgi:hypothetical protein